MVAKIKRKQAAGTHPLDCKVINIICTIIKSTTLAKSLVEILEVNSSNSSSMHNMVDREEVIIITEKKLMIHFLLEDRLQRMISGKESWIKRLVSLEGIIHFQVSLKRSISIVRSHQTNLLLSNISNILLQVE